MLIKCPECHLQVSDKALACPHCGYPMKPEIKKTKIKKTKRRRLPNGFGQISEIKGRALKKPFRAMITVGYSDTGKPICQTLKPTAYFSTYNEAYEALIKYNKKPYTLESDITVKQLFEVWYEEYKKSGVKDSSIGRASSAFKLCAAIYEYKIQSIEPFLIKDTLEKLPQRTMIVRCRFVLNMMFDFAVENGMLSSNPARQFKFSRYKSEEYGKVEKSHIDFTKEEMETLWENKDKSLAVNMILVQCYMGWRPQELCSILMDNVDLEKGFIVGGMKTKAGTNRSVPIHSKIFDIIKKQYERASAVKSQYLFYTTDEHGYINEMTYYLYQCEFGKILKYLELSLSHRPHDCRVHFVTMCKRYSVDEYAIKYMAGHKIADITESIYTKRGILWLKDEVEKIEE